MNMNKFHALYVHKCGEFIEMSVDMKEPIRELFRDDFKRHMYITAHGPRMEFPCNQTMYLQYSVSELDTKIHVHMTYYRNPKPHGDVSYFRDTFGPYPLQELFKTVITEEMNQLGYEYVDTSVRFHTLGTKETILDIQVAFVIPDIKYI